MWYVQNNIGDADCPEALVQSAINAAAAAMISKFTRRASVSRVISPEQNMWQMWWSWYQVLMIIIMIINIMIIMIIEFEKTAYTLQKCV